MNSSHLKEIEEIPYPEKLNPLLKRLPSLLLQGMKRDFSTVTESGTINIGELDEELKIPYFFYVWITELNEIIENLNLTLLDLRELPNRYCLLSGSPRRRFCLLVRLYFYEFYRFKEKFNEATKALSVHGNFDKTYLLEMQKTFYDAFKDTIKLRNSFVHSSVSWKGEEYFDLFLVECSERFGFMLKRKGNDKTLNIKDVLKDACELMVRDLQNEGNRMSCLLKDVTHGFCDLSIINKTTK